MTDLAAISPLDSLPAKTVGGVTLSETDLGALTSVAVYRGRRTRLGDALKKAHGMALPAANRATGKAGERAIWFGRDVVLLAGPAPDPQLADLAALTDQSDAWTCVTLQGDGAEDVLARLVPLDLRARHFKRGHTARTQLGHMNASITRIGADSFLILVFRSMARTLLHELETAMDTVAARSRA